VPLLIINSCMSKQRSAGHRTVNIRPQALRAGSGFNVRTSGGHRTLEEIASTIVSARDGRLVRVQDVASVRWAYADSTYRAFYNGRRAVFITVTQQERANITAVRDRIWDVLDDFERELPAGVTLERGFDQASIVSNRLARLGTDLLIATALVSVTLFPLGLRAAGLVIVAIPLSLAFGIILLRAAGFTINQLSIVGAVVALGLLVDDAIVGVENITRFIRAGKDRITAAIEATRQIAAAVLGATATLVLAFVPLLFLPGGPGQYIRSLPASVIGTIVGSLVVSLTIVPWLASRTLPHGRTEGESRPLRALERAIHAFYAPLLDHALRRPRLALGLAAAFVAGSIALLPVIGSSVFPKAETPQFYVNITAEEGASRTATLAAALFADSVIREHPDVRAVFTSAGWDNPRIYYNVLPRRENPAVGQLFVLLHRYDQKRTPALIDGLRTELAAYPGAQIEVREFENGPPIDAPIALRIVGPDLDTLRHIAAEVARILERTPGTQYVTNPVRLQRTDLHVAIDHSKAGLLGVSASEIQRTLRLGLAGIPVASLHEADGEARPVVVRLAGETRPRPGTLDRLYVASASGQLTPLRQVADVRFDAQIPEIRRVDRERAVTVTSQVRTGFRTDRVTRDALAAVDSLDLPPGYRIVPAGELESRRESFGGTGTAALIATFLILAVLVLEFGTFRSALIVASVIPLGLAGGIIALWLTGNTLSFVASIGAVALIGIEIKTTILIVDYTNRLREQGVPLEQAIRQAAEVRFLPILLTTMTAIGGLLPLALGGHALYAPLAWVIIGGLISSTLLARIITPVLYRAWPPEIAT